MPKLKTEAESTAERNGQSVLSEALRLHEMGYSIVPCVDKKPIVKGWDKRRLTEDELREMLDGKQREIAISWNQSKVFDAECDGPEAEANLQELFGGKIPLTPTWQSRRGKHRLFRRPDGLPHKAVIVLNGIEFRIGNGSGALSIVPPSVHPEGTRYWLPGLSIHDFEPADLPPAIVAKLQAAETAPAVEPSPDGDGIPEGKRNETLFQKACALRNLQLPEETIAATLLDLNQRLCRPPLPEAEVRAIAHSAATGDAKAKIGFLKRLLGDLELWHDQNADPYATLPQGDHRENWMIGKRVRAFRRWLSKLYYDTTGETIKADYLAEIAALLEGKAVFDGPEYFLWRRTAQCDGKFYVDLCDSEWQAVEIDGDGWRVVSNPPVKFRRAKAMHSLPLPEQTPGTSSRELLIPFLNIHVEQWPLVAAWVAAALRPVGPYPCLKLLGEQGSAKTTAARVLRSIIDPNAAPVRAEPRETRDMMIAANNGWVLCLDNLSTVKPDLSDALCRLSTGGGFATRTLYTDEDETIFDAQRPVILTSIEEVGTRSDLLERSLIIDLPPIHEGGRRAEKQFWAAFEKVRPRILGALLDVVSGAIRRLPEIERKQNVELPRLADFHVWGEACEVPLGLEPGTFAEAYAANRETATQTALESSPVVVALLEYMKTTRKLECTSTELLYKLGYDDPAATRSPFWPKTPRVLSQILKRVAPNLRQIGIVCVQDTRGGGQRKEKVWRIEGNFEPIKLPPRPREPSPLAEYLRAKGYQGPQGAHGSQKTGQSFLGKG